MSTPISPGVRLGRYEVKSRLGIGGMGEVYLAEDTKLNRKVAIKLLPPGFTADQSARKRLLREAQAAAALDHQNICSIYEVGEEDGRSFIVMQYVEGETLDLRMKRRPLELTESLSIATQVADALAEAHAHGIIHRDIKPSNIIITPRGQAKVMDFGLAKLIAGAPESEAATMSLLTTPGAIVGTMPYMSPEQVRGEHLDARTDIFSFGAVLYEMLSGRQAFASESSTATIAAILTHDPPALLRYAPDAPEELQRVVRKSLEKDRERRYQTMRDVALDLEQVGRGHEATRTMGARDVQTREESESALAKAPSGRWRTSRISRSVLVAAALVVTLVAAALIYALYLRRAPSTSAPEIKSLAVLPLDNFSGDPSQDYFADGMTEELTTTLAKISALRVISRTSVMQYKGTHKTVPEIARELNVDAIVGGSVQRAGDRVKITAQLVHSTDRHLWAETYERDLKDVLSLQSEVATAIAREIKIKLTPQQQTHLASERPVNPEAYDTYLKGLVLSNRVIKADNDTAIEMLERAVRIDPNFAIAYAALGRAYIVRFTYLAPQEGPWGEKALAAVEKALLLDPDLAEAHLARGFLLWTPSYHFPHESAVQEYHRALVLNPNLEEAHHQLAQVYIHIGLLDKALQELQTATAIDPSNNLAQYRVGVLFLYQGRDEEALAVFHKFPTAIDPSFWVEHLAVALFNLGRRDEAATVTEESLRRNPEDRGGVVHSVRAMLFAAAGDERQAEDNIKGAQEKGKGFIHFHHTAYNIACAYALMNKPEAAIEWLQKAADDGFPCYPLFELDHNLDHLRKDARFIDFMTKQKAQWEYYKATL